MAIPNVNQTILDPGLGLVESQDAGVTWIGPCSSGPLNVLQSFSSPLLAQQTLGEGPLVEAACHTLSIAGGPVRCVRATADAGAASAVVKAAAGSSTGTITLSGTPSDAFQGTVEITATGTLGTAEFRYRLDKSSTDLTGGSWSEVLTVPSGGSYVVPRTGLTLTFVPGGGGTFFEDGDVHTFTSTGPYFSTASLATAMGALSRIGRYGLIGLAGEPADSTDGVAMFAALDTQLASMQQGHQYFRALMNGGTDDEATFKASFADVSSRRITVSYGTATMASSKPYAGWGTPALPAVVRMVARAAWGTVSDDLARFVSGPEPGVIDISHDERVTELLDAPPHKISTLRSFVGESGYWITNARLKSPSGSDYQYLQHGRVMDLACSTTYGALLPFLNTSVRVNEDGTIDERDALEIEAVINDALGAALMQPRNLDNKPHVSAAGFSIDRDYNVLANETLLCTTAVRPLGYLKTIDHRIGYALNVGGGAS